ENDRNDQIHNEQQENEQLNMKVNDDDEFHDDVESEENEENEEDDEPQITVELHENPNNERVPIYPGALLTKEESNLLIMSFMIRHNLSDVALEDLLELIDCHMPRTVTWRFAPVTRADAPGRERSKRA
ncbi:hypothetical protein RF55_20936, partial [Lasius niger]